MLPIKSVILQTVSRAGIQIFTNVGRIRISKVENKIKLNHG
jgi:hypothetical protein